MRTKFINSIKAVFVFCFILFSVIACEKDFEDVGVTLVDNNLFGTNDSIFEVIAYTKNDSISRVGNLPLHNLGVYNDINFGMLNASFVTQIGIVGEIDFGLNPVIDTIILDIPYYATRETEDNSNGSPSFSLDSIIGDQDVAYTLKVKRLITFLNSLDPLDPTQVKRYYSDETYTGTTELYSGLFKPNKNDTVLYVNRRFFENEESIDTIKKEDISPSIKLPLDKTEIERIFLTEASESNLATFENFIQYFRGLMIQGEGNEGTFMSLLMSDASVNIYYTDEIPTVEAASNPAVDLNNDGDTLDTVNVKAKQTLNLPFAGVRASNYTRDYSGSVIEDFLNTPNMTSGQKQLFVQGAAGSIVEIELFKGIDLDEIRNQNWLINGAFLDLYVDNIDDQNIPNQLYLYNADANSTILDLRTDAINGIGGFLQRDGDDSKPLRYQFSITDYMSEVLKSDDPIEVAKLAVKMYHITDEVPQALRSVDTIIKDFSYNPQNVVLKGKREPADSDYEKRIKLTIFYTENNN